MLKIKVKDIMSVDMVTLTEVETLELAESIMRQGRIRHLPVVREKKLVGLVTHRDVLRAGASSLAELSPESRADLRHSIDVSQVMQTDVKTIDPNASVLETAKTLKKHKLGCLPVVVDGELVGIITETDFIDLVIRALETQA